MPPGLVSNFYGVAGFAAHATFQNVLKAPLRPWKQREYIDVPPWTITHTMERHISFIREFMKKGPVRNVRTMRPSMPTIIIASDAQVGPGKFPRGGGLLWDPSDGTKIGLWCEFADAELAMFELTMGLISEGAQPIALCEAAMIPHCLWVWRHKLAGRNVIWFCDNTSAMHLFVKGTSKNSLWKEL